MIRILQAKKIRKVVKMEKITKVILEEMRKDVINSRVKSVEILDYDTPIVEIIVEKEYNGIKTEVRLRCDLMEVEKPRFQIENYGLFVVVRDVETGKVVKTLIGEENEEKRID